MPYNQQGQIYFTCANFNAQSKETQRKIIDKCELIGGGYAEALFDVMTKAGHISVERIAAEHYVSAPTLYRLRKKFYESWHEKKDAKHTLDNKEPLDL